MFDVEFGSEKHLSEHRKLDWEFRWIPVHENRVNRKIQNFLLFFFFLNEEFQGLKIKLKKLTAPNSVSKKIKFFVRFWVNFR